MPGFLARIEFVLGVALLAIITGLVFIAAVMRFFGYPLIWSVDLAQLLFIWVCFLGAAKAMRERAHLGVDLLVRGLGHRKRLVLETILAAVFVVFLGALAVEGSRLTILNLQRLYGDSGLPYALVTIAVPAGAVMLIVAIVANVVAAWRSRAGGRVLVFARSTNDAQQSPTEL